MAADAGIFSQYLQPVKSVSAYRADMDREESNALQLAAGRMQAQQAKRDFEENERASQIAKDNSGGDYNALSAAFMQAGLPKRAQEVLNAGLKADAERTTIKKNQIDIDKGGIDLEEAKRIASLKRAIAFNSPQDAILDIQTRFKNGEMTQEQAEQRIGSLPQDQAGFAMWQLDLTKKLLSPEKRVEMVTAKPTEISTGQQKYFVDNNPNSPTFGQRIGAAPVQLQASPEAVLTDERTRSEGAANRGVQMRGQNMIDARSRDANAATLATKSEKPLTEGQAKSALFGSRMKMANEIFDTLEKSGTTTSTPGINSGYGVGNVISALSSSDQQQLLQAKRDFLNAVLRRESGAVIGESEFDNGNRQYFPQVGDSKQVIAQKKANREAAMRGVLVDVPEGRRSEIVGEITGTGRSTGGATGSFGAPAKGGFKYLGSE